MLRELYSQRDFMTPSDRDLILFVSVDRHLQRSTNSIMNWINLHYSLTNHSVKEADRSTIRGVRSIRTFFPAQPSQVKVGMKLYFGVPVARVKLSSLGWKLQQS